MKFVLSKTHRYWWPVTIRLPDPENAGNLIEQKLRMLFEPLPRDQEIRENEGAKTLTTLREIVDFEIARYLDVVRDWDGVVDDNGAVVPFSVERLEMALQFSWFRTGVKAAFDVSVNGEQGRLGN